MPGTTPVYGFPYPEPTDLVADYPALGQDLAEDIEAVLPTLGALSLISPTSIANSGGTASTSNGTTTFTTVNSISLNGVFGSTYAGYRVMFSGASSLASATLTNIRLRLSGTDATGSNYWSISIYANNAPSAQAYFTAAGTTGQLAGLFNNDYQAVFDIMNPGIADKTTLHCSHGTSGTAEARGGVTYVSHNLSTAYDGFTIYPATGTITGKMRVYAYKGA